MISFQVAQASLTAAINGTATTTTTITIITVEIPLRSAISAGGVVTFDLKGVNLRTSWIVVKGCGMVLNSVVV